MKLNSGRLGLTSEQAQAAWESAIKSASGRRITARLVKSAVKELQQGAALTHEQVEPDFLPDDRPKPASSGAPMDQNGEDLASTKADQEGF